MSLPCSHQGTVKGHFVPSYNQNLLIVYGGILPRISVDYLKLVIDLLLMLIALPLILLINCPYLLTLILACPSFLQWLMWFTGKLGEWSSLWFAVCCVLLMWIRLLTLMILAHIYWSIVVKNSVTQCAYCFIKYVDLGSFHFRGRCLVSLLFLDVKVLLLTPSFIVQ